MHGHLGWRSERCLFHTNLENRGQAHPREVVPGWPQEADERTITRHNQAFCLQSPNLGSSLPVGSPSKAKKKKWFFLF